MFLGTFECALEALRPLTGCAVWKEAMRLSKVKKFMATSWTAILAFKKRIYVQLELRRREVNVFGFIGCCNQVISEFWIVLTEVIV
jgi:hypothetical protein